MKTNQFKPSSSPAVAPLESPQSFATLLRVTPQAVRDWIREGTIPTVICAGRVMRFEREAALAALNGKPAPVRASRQRKGIQAQ